MTGKNILLVEPNFPYPNKSKNKANNIHKNFIPIGLLKIGRYYKEKGYNVKLVRGNKTKNEIGFEPSKIFITSIFTYWSEFVWDAVKHYRELYKDADITIGGIYVTLHYKNSDFISKSQQYNVKFHVGLFNEAERYLPDYSLLSGEVDHHVTHASRGCIRRCKFCGAWKIEPKRTDKTAKELIDELKKVGKNRVIFFDNNFLANNNIIEILESLANLKVNGKVVTFECQSGFDGRILEKHPEYAKLLKKARFKNIRIAWDNGLEDALSIENQINLLIQVGYKNKDISIFMIYNYDIPYESMIKKIDYCKKWGVQIIDCRYRPLECTFDYFNPITKKQQTSNDYYIHSQAGWTDKKIRSFRKMVRQHNIWIRYAKDKGLEYDINMEKWSSIHNIYKYFNLDRPPIYDKIKKDDCIKIRIYKLNKLKKFYNKIKMTPLDFSMLDDEQLDKTINTLCLINNLK